MGHHGRHPACSRSCITLLAVYQGSAVNALMRVDSDDDEAGYRFGTHTFVPGEYVTIRDQNSAHTFRVVAVENA